jgi:hypothetical protein
VSTVSLQLQTKVRGIRGFLSALRSVSPVVLLCLLFSIVVTVPAQSLEVYRYIAQSLIYFFSDLFESYSYDRQVQGLFEGAILIVSVTLLSLALIAVSMYLQVLQARHVKAVSDAVISRVAVALVACIPFVAIGAGFIRAATIDVTSPDLRKALTTTANFYFEKLAKIESFNVGSTSTDPSGLLTLAIKRQLVKSDVDTTLSINDWLHSCADVMLFLGALLFIAALVVVPKRLSKWPRNGSIFSRLAGACLAIAGIAIPTVLSLIFAGATAPVARAFTPLGLICLFFCVAALLVAVVSYLETSVRLPILYPVLVLAFIFSYLEWNENHDIRALPLGAPPPAAISVGEGFKQWLKARRDLERYETYPVYIVAAEGGGIYAAFRTAHFLAGMQDQCPRFSQHLFAISSVSGGSIGAAVFSGLVRKIKQSEGRFGPAGGCVKVSDPRFDQIALNIMQQDFLSPVLASFLFPDLLQKFLFFSVPQFDRSIALERSLESAWDQQTKPYRTQHPDQWLEGNPLQEPFVQQWTPTSDGPALFINTTEIESGHGRVISPLLISECKPLAATEHDAPEFTNFPLPPKESTCPFDGINISLSTAAVLSARFPWLTPPGLLRDASQKIYLVDGGYLDNSGLETALKIVHELQNTKRKVQINLIVLTSKQFKTPPVVLNDYLGPLDTLFSARTARNEAAISQAEIWGAYGAEFWKMEMQGYGYPLPLGWRLSPMTEEIIVAQTVNADGCGQDESRNEMDCLKRRIYQDMSQ